MRPCVRFLRLERYPDGAIAVFLGADRLADYRPDGTIVQTTEQAAEHDSTAAKFSRKMRTDNELPKPDTFMS